MPDQHAFLSPSSAERWYHCPPSAWLCEQFPDLGSVFAAEGTEAHSLCEYLVNRYLGHTGLADPRPGMKYYTEEMEECCQGYLSYVTELVEGFRQKGEKPAVYVEQRVDLRKFIPESMGTSDCVIVGSDELVIVDFKYGMHPVPATSLQLRIYALGACELFASLYDFTSVRMVVYQPRIGNVDCTSLPVEELYAWASGELKERAQCAFTGKGELRLYMKTTRSPQRPPSERKRDLGRREDYIRQIAPGELRAPARGSDRRGSDSLPLREGRGCRTHSLVSSVILSEGQIRGGRSLSGVGGASCRLRTGGVRT